MARERQDVQRAEDKLEDLQEEQRGLEIEVEEEVRALQADLDAEAVEVEEVLVRPKKADLQVTELRLAWRPA